MSQMSHNPHLPDDIPVDTSYGAFLGYDSDGAAESVRSLASSTHDFRYENGRRYHGYRDGVLLP